MPQFDFEQPEVIRMRYHTAFRSLLGLLTLLWISPIALGLSTAEFFAEYEPAVKKLRDFYSNIELHATSLVYESEGRKPETKQYVVYANGPHLRLDTVLPDARGANGESKARATAIGEQVFRVGREGGSKDYILRNVGTDVKRASHVLLGLARFFRAAYCKGDSEVLNALRFPGVTITSIDEQRERDGELKVIARYQYRRAQRPLYVGRYVFLPEKAWVVSESSLGVEGAKSASNCLPGLMLA